MSEKAELAAPLYKIFPIIARSKSVGAGRILPTSQRVHVDADLNVWKIIKQKHGVFRLSLEGPAYPYTGVEHGKEVVVTTDQGCDEEWCINYWVQFKAWSIELNTGIRPALAWTVSSDKNIVLQPYELQPDESQLFNLLEFFGP